MEIFSRGKASGSQYRLTPFLSPLGVWAFGVGTAIGWGSFVVTSNSYLLVAGPLGSIIGIAVGTLVMLAIASNYSYLMQRYPSSGGSYTYVSHVLGKDRGFLTAWYLGLTYLAVFWANATSLPLFARYFFGDQFIYGRLYTLFGYDINLGEVLITFATIACVGVLCTKDKRLIQRIMIALAIVFTCGITICFAASIFAYSKSGISMQPALLPDVNALKQILGVGIMTPWAFIGFESVSHATEELDFPHKKIPALSRTIVIATAALYAMVIIMSVTAYPAKFDNWFDYLSNLGRLQGIEALPPFYAAYRAMGNIGLNILVAALFALIVTSLIGNLMALSRLFVAASHDGILPERFSQLSAQGAPENAILSVVAASILVLFIGRTAIGWIVDITTIGAIIVYGLVSYSARKAARTEGDAAHSTTGMIGTVSMALLALAIALPNLLSSGSMEQETYFLITIWSILGFVYLRFIMMHDKDEIYGQSVGVWIAMVSFVLFSSTAWLQKSHIDNAQIAVDELSSRFASMGMTNKQVLHDIIQQSMQKLEMANLRSTLISVGLFVVSLALLMSNYAFVRKRNDKNRTELGAVKEAYNRDTLTGVKSKHAFAESEREINERISNGDIEAFGVVVCDINGLKYVNDTQGHKAGDEYIRAACRIICAHFKRSPVYRIGGDEFVAFLQGEDYKNRDAILASFDEKVEGNIGSSDAVVSAGISVFDPTRDTSFHDVFERADALMYQRKMQLKSMGATTRD